ncbi:MAG: FAD-binding oxidoreductase [Chloroflexi bacterium]|nr:MAG: FAD-binding oxidoreductase [Chloroflexota bacterium]
MKNDQAFIQLQQQLPSAEIITDPILLITYENDASLDYGQPDGVVIPRSAADVAKIVDWANEFDMPIVARGAGTGLSGGAVAHGGGIILNFALMRQMLDYDAEGRSVVVEPGMVNQQLGMIIDPDGLVFPPDPSSGRVSTIGGNIAENAGGPHCFKYGVTTNYVMGLQMVAANGRILQLGGQAFDYPEYDFVGLLTGSEGTLGVITAASLRLLRQSPGVKTLTAVFETLAQAGTAVSAIIAAGLTPASMEMMDQQIIQIVEDYVRAGLPTDAGAMLILDVDGYEDSLTIQMQEIVSILKLHEAGGLHVAETEREREQLWYARKSAAGAMSRLAPAFYLVDGVVPRSKLSAALTQINQICEQNNLHVGHVFHAGDGNLHPLILIDDPKDKELIERVVATGGEVMKLCVSMGGSITGEHGVGLEKKAYMPLMFSPNELCAMREVKELFDPYYRLNPGKIFPKNPTTNEQPVVPAPTNDPVPTFFAPESTEELASALVALGNRSQVPSVGIYGGKLGVGEKRPFDITLSLQNLRGIKSYAPDDMYVTVGAGTPLVELQAELAKDQLWVPLASPWPEATIGGIVSTNFNAPLRMRYGAIRDLVLMVEVVLGNGRVMQAGRPVVKNAAGYDLRKLFIGAYGTLGVITEITLKLLPKPRKRTTLMVPYNQLSQGVKWAMLLSQNNLIASSIVLCSQCRTPGNAYSNILLYTVEGIEEDVNAEINAACDELKNAGAVQIMQTDSPRGTYLWTEWLHQASAESGVLRAAVPPQAMPQLINNLGLAQHPTNYLIDIVHGFLYMKGIEQLKTLHKTTQSLSGYAMIAASPPNSLANQWEHTPDSLALMHGLKSRWDPTGLLNPKQFLV